jgi:hypothetical protein
LFQFLVQITNFNQEADDREVQNREVTSTNLQIMNFNQEVDDREVQNSM